MLSSPLSLSLRRNAIQILSLFQRAHVPRARDEFSKIELNLIRVKRTPFSSHRPKIFPRIQTKKNDSRSIRSFLIEFTLRVSSRRLVSRAFFYIALVRLGIFSSRAKKILFFCRRSLARSVCFFLVCSEGAKESTR